MNKDYVTQLLKQPLDRKHVLQRKGGGYKTLSYIEGWHAIAECNRIFGFLNWDRHTVYCKEVCRYQVKIGKEQKAGWKVGYEAKVIVSVDGTQREGTGAGSGISMDLYDAIESAAKEAETDAMKRALMTFGNPFGLALYDKKQSMVQDGVPVINEEEADDFQKRDKDLPLNGAASPKQLHTIADEEVELRAQEALNAIDACKDIDQLRSLWTELDKVVRDKVEPEFTHKSKEFNA